MTTGELGEERNWCHVLLVPYPSQGHINPLLQFAKRLASRSGLKCTLATTHNTLPPPSASSPPKLTFEPISDGTSADFASPKGGSEHTFLSSLRSHGSESLSNLISNYSTTHAPVACVVYDAFLPWALDVARQHGVPGAAFFTNSAVVSAVFSCVHAGKLGLPLDVQEVERLMPGIRPPFGPGDLPSFLKRPESYPAYLEMKLGQFGNLGLADWVFCNSFDDLELEFLEGIIPNQWPAKLIGPMVPSFYTDKAIEGDRAYGSNLWKPRTHQCKQFLAKKPPKSVIYISFGSMVSPTPTQMHEIAAALEEADFPFIWVVRESQLHTLPIGFQDSSAANDKGIVVTWCNQLEVLAHESTGCFVTHCGWNSTLEGLSLGVPMVGIPQWSDQFTDAKFIEEIWKVGVRAKEDGQGVVRKQEFVSCLREVISLGTTGQGPRRDEIKRNAFKWKESAKRALTKGGSSYDQITHFIDTLKTTAVAVRKIGRMEINGGAHF